MRRSLSSLLFLFAIVVATFAQQQVRVDLSDATSPITSSLNLLNTLTHDLSKKGEVAPEINLKIRSITAMVVQCRQSIIIYSMNEGSMSDEKKAKIVSISKTLENDINNIDKDATNDEILFSLSSVEKKNPTFNKAVRHKSKKQKEVRRQ